MEAMTLLDLEEIGKIVVVSSPCHKASNQLCKDLRNKEK